MVSVVIPVYNTDKYLSHCLDSLIKQTIDKIEIICVNDCSSDKSKEIIKEYSLKDKRIILIDNKIKHGAGISRNIGLNVARGEYVFFMDSDDYISNNFLQELYNTAKKYDSDYVSSLNIYDVIDSKEYVSHLNKVSFLGNDDLEGISSANIKNLSPTDKETIEESTWSKLWRREFLINNNIYYSSILCYQDTEQFFKSLIHNPRISFNHKPIYYYRQHIHTISTKKNTDINYFKTLFVLLRNCIDYYEEDYIPYLMKNFFDLSNRAIEKFADKNIALNIFIEELKLLNLDESYFINESEYLKYKDLISDYSPLVSKDYVYQYNF
ncbi:glycosyltransferase family 2 protein [Brachyspira sp. SAP_772]|uniref:glycosyltransferase family 2 protein n=1 Tax=Brachyspira sp. SAP_772 TaxID=2608385 RepID=UPI0012F5061C|nr:glycosyltransferase family 2 protein [Brachyspira sp. SAP_772]